jgi:NTP pyrophosphatase (non-canonical NTP hydrolase)
MTGEVGELATAIEKWMWYGQVLDQTNIKEELGDLLWYIAELCNALNLNLADVMDCNIAKLQKRYPEKFTEQLAAEENRDRAAEREAIEVPNVGMEMNVGIDIFGQDAELKAKQFAREHRCLCPECKMIVNDEVVRQLHSPKHAKGVFTCHCGCRLTSKDLICTVYHRG